MTESKNFQKIGELLNRANQGQPIKPPAYQWQDFALKIIRELAVPRSKKNAVFKVCKENNFTFLNQCLNDTLELAQKERWRYFFKLIGRK